MRARLAHSSLRRCSSIGRHLVGGSRSRGPAPPALDVLVAVSDAVAKLSNTLALVTRGQRHTRELPELGGSFEGTGQPKQSIKRVNESLQVVNGLKEGAGDARLAR